MIILIMENSSKCITVIILSVLILGIVGCYSKTDLRSSGLKIVPPKDGIYLGAYNWVENNQPGAKEFEDAVGKKVGIIGAQCIPSEFLKLKLNVSCLNKLYNKGYVTEIDITARDPAKNFTAQNIIDGKADYVLEEIANDLISFNKPIFFGYPREPVIQAPLLSGPEGKTESWGYGPKGDKVRSQVNDPWGQYTSPNGDSCNTMDNIICDDGRERYRDMARHIHDKIESIAPGRATWVMGAVIDRQPGAYASWYPGNNYVDWLAIDEYPYMRVSDEGVVAKYFFDETIEPDWSEALKLAPNKPFMITELGVYNNKTIGNSDKNFKIEFYDRAQWFNNFFQTVRTTHPQLKAIIYWQFGTIAFDNSNTRIRVGDSAALAWRADILANPDFWISDVTTAGGKTVKGSGGGVLIQISNETKTSEISNAEKETVTKEDGTEKITKENQTSENCFDSCVSKGNTGLYCDKYCAGTPSEEKPNNVTETEETPGCIGADCNAAETPNTEQPNNCFNSCREQGNTIDYCNSYC